MKVIKSRGAQTGTGTADGQTSVPRQLPSLDSAKIDVDDQSVEPVEELEKKRSEEFQKILEVSKEERDRVQRMQVVDRAAAAIAAARAILEDKNNKLRTEAGDRGGSGGGSGGGGDGTIGARQEEFPRTKKLEFDILHMFWMLMGLLFHGDRIISNCKISSIHSLRSKTELTIMWISFLDVGGRCNIVILDVLLKLNL
ncbi:hypothetical protein DVH24_012094 [Malus domestica]|uniref:Uncharacterized protein n=1 Tax=Malus domestica TaxID=3750 RepID=A0A498HNU7_MALDO|nr:hypothetical protein DVH24_012094 [Malus domestica]